MIYAVFRMQPFCVHLTSSEVMCPSIVKRKNRNSINYSGVNPLQMPFLWGGGGGGGYPCYDDKALSHTIEYLM